MRRKNSGTKCGTIYFNSMVRSSGEFKLNDWMETKDLQRVKKNVEEKKEENFQIDSWIRNSLNTNIIPQKNEFSFSYHLF